MNLLNRLNRQTPIAIRLGMAIAVSFLMAAALGVIVVNGLAQSAAKMGQLQALSQFSMRIGDAIHELQKERGLSSVFLNSSGQAFTDPLTTQRHATDERLMAVRDAVTTLTPAAYSPDLRAIIEASTSAARDIAARREDISSRRISPLVSTQFFTGMIGKLLAVPREAVKSSEDPVTTASLMAYFGYLSAKERAGLERATGAGAFAAGQFTADQYHTYLGLLADQRAFFEIFASYAKPDQKTFEKQTVAGAVVDTVERMRQLAIDAGPATPLGGATAAEWFKAATARIDLMKLVENRLASDLETYAGFAASKARNEALTTGIIVFGALVLSGLLGTVLVIGITRPLSGMTSTMLALADGDLFRDIPALGNKDEIGHMARAVQVFRDKGIENKNLAEARQVEQALKERRSDNINQLIATFDTHVTQTLQSLSSSATDLSATATSLTETAAENARQLINVAAASEQATANVQTVATATGELSSSVTEIGRQMEQSNRIAMQAVAEADVTTTAIQGLAEMARKVDNVVQVISDIASQTNLLALNATIEAARAGEAGKGFAVVASEVKALANRTAKATEEVSRQINEMQSETAVSVGRIEAITRTIAEMSKIATVIASAVEEQGAATQIIAHSVREAATGTRDVSVNIAGVARSARETDAAAGQVKMSSSDVAQQGNRLKTEVGLFLERICAA